MSLLHKLSFIAFRAFERVGVHVIPKHYYTPIADHHWLANHKGAWTKRAPMTGVHWNLDEQFAWLKTTCEPYLGEVAGLKSYEKIVQSQVGPGYGPIESQVLHAVIRARRPKNIVEIGSGVSTAIMLQALEANRKEGHEGTQITCVEPFPKPAFRNIQGITHVEEICQTVPASTFEHLGEGDLLFIDSSHALKTGSDVSAIYLHVVPALRPGVLIHIHDVWLPYLYSPFVLNGYFDWQETPLLLALLTNNPKLQILAGLAALQLDREAPMRTLLPDFRPLPITDGLALADLTAGHYASSLWLQTR
jgi:predicted O-methyltransferase YrrM